MICERYGLLGLFTIWAQVPMVVHAMKVIGTTRNTYSMSPGTQAGPCYESKMNHQHHSQFVSVAASKYCLLQLHHPHAIVTTLVVILKQANCKTNIIQKKFASYSLCCTYCFPYSLAHYKAKRECSLTSNTQTANYEMVYFETVC